MKKILVIGSLNADLSANVETLPYPGETIRCTDFTVGAGGKGMNQAVQAARLGANVTMAGCVGDDSYGRMLCDKLIKEGINTEYVKTVKDCSTGMAMIATSPKDNEIIIIPGANACTNEDYVTSLKEVIFESDLVILQLEIPLNAVYMVINLCAEKDIPVLLNPAPAERIDFKYMDQISYLTPNETELTAIFGKPKEEVLKEYPNKIIMSAGKDGAYYHDGTNLVHCEAKKVDVVDTTGAGDAFNGALACAILDHFSLKEAVEYANGIAAIATTKKGAQG